MTLLFLLLYRINIKNNIARCILSDMSLKSYEMFLFSYLCDQLIYPGVIERYYTNQNEFGGYFVPITITVIIISYILASVYHKVAEWIGRLKI